MSRFTLGISTDYESLKRRVNLEVRRSTRERRVRACNTLDAQAAVGISTHTLYKLVPSKESIRLGAAAEKAGYMQRHLSVVVPQGANTTEKLVRNTERVANLLLDLSPSTVQQTYRPYPR